MICLHISRRQRYEEDIVSCCVFGIRSSLNKIPNAKQASHIMDPRLHAPHQQPQMCPQRPHHQALDSAVGSCTLTRSMYYGEMIFSVPNQHHVEPPIESFDCADN